jgi:sulfur carrier protein ThiS
MFCSYSIKRFNNLFFVLNGMDVFIEKTGKKIKLMFRGNVGSLLDKLKINSETVIVVRNNMLLTERDTLKNKDFIKIMSVISGG